MEKEIIEAMYGFVSPQERARLVRFCARITKNGDVAEDVVQETLLEGWRNEHKLRDSQRRGAWLLGVHLWIAWATSACVSSAISRVE